MKMDKNLYISAGRYKTCQGIFENLAEIPYAVIKGEPLSMLAYGSYGKRSSTDIDILLPKSYLDQVKGILHDCGFQSTERSRVDRITLLNYSHQIAPWIKGTRFYGSVMIDLNFDIFWGEYDGTRIDLNYFLKDTEYMDIYSCKVKTLCLYKQLIVLCLHDYKDLNSIFLIARQNRIDKRMFADIYNLIQNNREEIDILDFRKMCENLHIKHFVYYVLYYTKQIFSSEFIERLTRYLEDDEGNKLLNCYGLNERERKVWKYDFGTRINSECLFDLIRSDLDEADYRKLELNKQIFGDGNNEKNFKREINGISDF